MSFYIKQNKLLGNKVKRKIADPLSFSWNSTQESRTWQAICCSNDGSKLAAVVYGGFIYTSSDGGLSWTQRENERSWSDISCSYDGSELIACEFGGKIYISLDSGVSWTPRENDRQWISVAANHGFGRLIAAVQGGRVYISSNSGTSWTPVLTDQNWSCVSINSGGSKLIASAYEDYLYISTDSGVSWSQRGTPNAWTGCHVSLAGSTFAACAIDSPLYITLDNGLSWTTKETSRYWGSISIMSNGSRIVATSLYSDNATTASPGQIHFSADGGETWTFAENNRYWVSMAMSSDFRKIVALEVGGQIHIGNVIISDVVSNHINSSVISRLINKNPSTSRLVYSSQNPYGGVGDAGFWTRNPDCWLNGISNISCFSPAQRSGANWWQRGGALITTKHVLFAAHFAPSIISGGTPLIFVDENNNAIRRNIISYGLDSNIDGVTTDIAIALLDSDVPSNIKIAKVLPKNYTQYLDIIGPETNLSDAELLNYGPYAVGLDQEEKAILKWVAGTSSGSQGISIYNVPSMDPYYSFTETMITGDSGNPVFLIIENELVLLMAWLTSSGGPFITARYDAVNTIINNLSPGEGYSLTPVDLELVYQKYN